MGDEFEWDHAKAASNHRKHGVGFAEARQVFADAFALLELDRTQGEERLILTGMASGRILVVVFVDRGECVRIISARKATRREQHGYYQNQTSS